MEELDLRRHIEGFIELLRDGSVQVYNEISLQCELVMFFRQELPAGWKVELERNIRHFGLDKASFLKRELDIAVYREGERHCIELKFPQQGQVPEQMFSACKDICFLEQLTHSGFAKSYFLMLTPDPLFYTPRFDDPPFYAMFRARLPITGTITKPTGAKDVSFAIEGVYMAEWQSVSGNLKYCLVELVQ